MDVCDDCRPMPPRPAGELQGGTAITLALGTVERLRPEPDLVPRTSPSLEVGTA
jgi:hypothetical protein